MAWSPAPHRLRLPEGLEPETGQRIALEAEESHHLLRVRRARQGSRVDLLDGAGRVYSGDVEADGLIATVTVDVIHEIPRPQPRITVALALLKGGNFEDALQRTTELGVHRLIPLICTRCEAKLDPDKVQSRLDRWRAIAWESCKQSANPWLPVIDEPVPLLKFAANPCPGRRFVGALTPETALLSTVLAETPERVTIAIGPEGDWTDEELNDLRQKDFEPVSFGPTILRAETAAMAGVSSVRALATK